MKTFDILSMGLRNLLRRKTRTLLTVVGVVVGATAIVMMVSLGIGMNESLAQMIANMGDLTVIEIQSYAYIRGANDEYTSTENQLNDALLEQIRQIDGVLAVTPYMYLYASAYSDVSIYAGKRYQAEWAQIYGVDPSFLPYLKYEVERGDIPTPDDEHFILFGADHVYFVDPNKPSRNSYKDMYNDDGTRKPPKIDILTQSIYMQGKASGGYWDSMGNYVQNTSGDFRFKKYTFDKIGIMKADDRNWETRYNTYVDIETAIAIQTEIEKANKVSKSNSRIGKYDTIKIKAADIQTAEAIQEQLADMGIAVMNYLAETRDELQAQQSTSQMILGGIGAMSLIVAAIGIANTMFMSIYERTKEIGVMKVLGCPLAGIKSMFLFEAGTIGFFGGLAGVGLSLAGSYAMNNVPFISQAFRNMGGAGVYYSYYGDNLGNISVIPLWLVTAAIIFSTIIGLASGYLPARRATKISALEAIRNE